MANIKYTEDHDWLRKEDHGVRVGITDHAQNELGDIVFVELPEVGDEYAKGEEMVVIESVKSVSDVEAPVAGTVEEVNESLEGEPEKINESPTDEGWLVKLDMKDEDQFSSLLDESEYKDLLE
ncbi:glycine cleavage system protein GcvH [Candidatus Bipolaricaulota bacterium]|nr:glycine cleavage system protein GcvH [Candidatus Bipolaricaulota bacterium]